MLVARVTEGDLEDLLPLGRAYCDFYDVVAVPERLEALSRALLADPEREGLQLIARGEDGAPLGFATVFWSWSTLRARRIGVMNDLFVDHAARGRGVADALIGACLEACRRRGAAVLEWQTATDNHRAQAVYDRSGARREQLVDYSLEA